MNDLVSYDQQWAEEASSGAAKEKLTSGGRAISHRGGVFRIGDDLEFPELCVIVLASAFENAYFASKFDPDNLEPPRCFALAEDMEDLAPHAATHESDWFEPQNVKCYGCPRNEFPKKGENKRKECRNSRRLLVLPAGQYTPRKGSRDLDLELFIGDDLDEAAEYVRTGDLFTLKLPPSALKPYKELVHKLQREYNRPPHGMVLRCFTEPLRNGGHTVSFEPIGQLEDALYPAISERRESDRELLMRPYSEPEE